MSEIFGGDYGDNPWEGIVDKTRDIYIPDLLDVYKRESIFRGLIPYKVDLGAANALNMTFTTMYDLRPDTTPLGLRQLWSENMITDSEQKTITLNRYGGKVAMHDTDDLLNQWRAGGVNGLRQINRNLLARQMTGTLDLLARNAFMGGTYKMYKADGSGTGFDDLLSNGTDDFDPTIARQVWLGAMSRGRNGAVDASTGAMNGSTIVAVTTPGVMFSIVNNADFIDIVKYARPELALQNEVGTLYGVRYINAGPDMILWNCGTIAFQGTVIEPVFPGSGAARNVDANRTVGQAALAGGNRYIQMHASDNLSGIAVNDIVTLHKTKTSVDGVTNGVNYREPTLVNGRVVSVDNGTKRIALDVPILRDYTTALATDVYGYVTKATSVHPTIFLTGPNPVVAGVGRPPAFHNPDPIDDFQRYYRFSWDAYMEYQIWNDQNSEVVFTSGQYRVKGPARR